MIRASMNAARRLVPEHKYIQPVRVMTGHRLGASMMNWGAFLYEPNFSYGKLYFKFEP